MTDYKDFKPTKDFRPNTANASQREVLDAELWWKIDERDAHRAAQKLYDIGKDLRAQGQSRRQMNLINARLYSNFDLAGFGARDYSRALIASLFPGTLPTRIAFNVIASCIDSLNSKIGKNKPRPMFLTDGQSWKMQQKARKLTRFTDGLFYETKVHEEAKSTRLDAYIFGTGAMQVFKNAKGRLAVERVFIDELYVDDADGIYGRPTQLLRNKVMDRHLALEQFGDTPEREKIIMEADTSVENKPLRGNGDLVEIWEGWKLPDAKGKGGRHMLTMNGKCIFDEPWKLDKFPFVFRRYRRRVRGFWGQGISEMLTGLQVELNRLVRSISEQLRRRGKGRIFAPLNSIDPAQLDNSISPIVFFKGGVPPITDNNNAVSAEEFMQVKELYARAFQEVGISELSAQSKKPAGLDAAVAMREFNDIETERFALDAQADERFFMDFAELALDLVREDPSGYKVKLPNKRFVIEIDWNDIDLQRDAYTMQMFPVSSLPGTPSARLQRVEELRAGGYIDMPTAKRLLDFPDITMEEELSNAAADDADACISQILDEATPKRVQLEPYQDVGLLLSRAQAAYLFAKHHGAEDDRLDMLRELIDACAAKKDQLMQAQAAMVAPPPPGAAPGGPNITNNVSAPVQPPAPVAPPVVA